jgi:hypothetical protein
LAVCTTEQSKIEYRDGASEAMIFELRLRFSCLSVCLGKPFHGEQYDMKPSLVIYMLSIDLALIEYRLSIKHYA